ncbi:MAG: hypothetical protein KatS3mg087_2148 [Patescibacteria group bacterium]|uniref:CRISPR-associated protein Cas5 n=1 Tax=Thermonema sp. TaxID=2231181 RepID=UPI0021DCBB78|nr:CRISPR-associated protein Cas5 [Thermonema sp.]GIV39349.1 MAG: hypothetical protein KatS3mg033_1149 [Thermonema sp.]GIW61082.1 MAG: hypothetical protein KatS3mg087_2148 [Patescibacteria group bacterium]
MKAFRMKISGQWAHFRRTETNNQPLTHNIIPKTALIGLMGAVSGWERAKLRKAFPQLCQDIAYSVKVPAPLSKMSFGFTARPSISDVYDKSRKTMEIIRNPQYEVIVALRQTGSDAEALFSNFVNCLKSEEQYYPAVLGLHNCPCNLELLDEGEVLQENEGEFDTSYFVLSSHKPRMDTVQEVVLGFDKIPTIQNSRLRNLPDSYVPVVFPVNASIKVEGKYNQYRSNRQNVSFACVLV